MFGSVNFLFVTESHSHGSNRFAFVSFNCSLLIKSTVAVCDTVGINGRPGPGPGGSGDALEVITDNISDIIAREETTLLKYLTCKDSDSESQSYISISGNQMFTRIAFVNNPLIFSYFLSIL